MYYQTKTTNSFGNTFSVNHKKLTIINSNNPIKIIIMNTTPLLSFIYDRKHVGTVKKEAPVELRVTYDRKQKYISTGIKLLPKQWQGGFVKNRPDADAIRDVLDNMMKDVRNIIAKMQEEGKIDINEIPERLGRNNKKDISFLDYMKERALVRKYGKTDDSQKRYDRFMKFFLAWGKIKQFSDITDTSIILMDEELAAKGMKPYSKWNNYHRFLNSFILDAIDEGLIKRNPYKRIQIEKDKSNGGLNKYLTMEEFEKIRNLQPSTPYLERVRDLFIFQTYTCLSYTDLASFKTEEIKDVNGKKVYIGKRGKTKQEFTFLLLKPALQILEKYKGKLPIISNVKYNEYLKVIAMAANIKKPISTHWARHTGATLLLNEGVEMNIVSKICGHSSTKITEQVYAKLLDETVIDKMSMFEKQLSKKKL